MSIFVIILILIVIYFIYECNTFIRLKNKIKQSKSSIEVYLNQRFDLIPNLVATVKGYVQYEEKVYSQIIKLREIYNVDTVKDLKKGALLNAKCNGLLAVAENMPDLKASKHFLDLQKTLVKLENQLQAARRIYNGDVTLYNTTISTFPNNIFAKIFGFQEETLFEIEEYKKDNISLDE